MRPLSSKIPDELLPRLWDGTQLEYRFPLCMTSEIVTGVSGALIDKLGLNPTRILVDRMSLSGDPSKLHVDIYRDRASIPPDPDLLREYDICILHMNAEVGIDFFEVCMQVKTLVFWPNLKFYNPIAHRWEASLGWASKESPTSLHLGFNNEMQRTLFNANGRNAEFAIPPHGPQFAQVFTNP